MYPRNGIEGTHSELVRGHGLRRTKYRGLQPGRAVALLHGCCLQCETILKTVGFPDRNGGSEPRVRVESSILFTSMTALR